MVGYIWPVDEPKKVMVIIHGIGEHSGRYDRMAGYLNDAGIAVVSMDLPGHGLSRGKRGHISNRDKLMAAVTSMIDYAHEKYPDIPLVLYGHSMGGNICLDYRVRGERNALPEKYIVSAPWIKLVKSVPVPVFKVVRGVSKVIPTISISTGCEPEDLGNLIHTGDYNDDPLVHHEITIKTAADCMDVAEGLTSGKYMDNKRAKGKPFLLMHGTDDKICDIEGSRRLEKRYKKEENFKYIEWEGYYHEIHNGGPNHTGEEVIETIRDFVLEE